MRIFARGKIIAGIVALALVAGWSSAVLAESPPPPLPRNGLWITCFGEPELLGSERAMDEAVAFAKRAGFHLLFVQVYRGGQSWFDSETADAAPFRKNREKVGQDPLKLLIGKAHAAGIEVHAWVNTLTLSKNEKAPLLKSFGTEVLTKDQHGATAIAAKPSQGIYRYYDREDQLFLEPGDPRVQQHLRRVIGELTANYPALDGIHFDYIRYPASPPFIPGSRFSDVGLCYGYGERNVVRFREATGIDPTDLVGNQQEGGAWDAWRRDQVTGLLRSLVSEARGKNPRLQLSCAAIAAFDRAYASACQDWGLWVREGSLDFIVLMNYTLDTRFLEAASRAAFGIAGDPQKVSIGLAAYLMKDRAALLKEQLRVCEGLRPRGVVVFDYATASEPPLRALFQGSETVPKH